MKTLLISLLLGLIGSCANDKSIAENTSETKNQEILVGKWKAVSLFLSDASTGVCHQNKPTKDITFEFNNLKTEDQKGYQFSGSGPVNQYFGTITFLSFDETKNQGKIAISTLGSTKMAGSPEMMDCEQNYFTMLGESTGFQWFADEPNRIIIGKLKTEDSHPRDGGTYFVFEKIK